MRKICPLFFTSFRFQHHIHLASLIIIISSYILKLTYLAASARQPLFRPDRAPVPSAGGPGSCAPPLRTWTDGGREVGGASEDDVLRKGRRSQPRPSPLSAPQNRADASARSARERWLPAARPPALLQNDIGHKRHMECNTLQGLVRADSDYGHILR